jgi:DNA-binding MarR family transcriptional regulator
MSLTTGSTLSTLERTGPRRITDLAVIEGVTQPSMTTLVTRLEEAGLVQRDRDPLDGRVVRAAVTEAGSDYVLSRRRAMTDSFGALIDKLPPDEYAALEAAVPAMVHLQDLDGESRVTTRTTIQPGGHQ